MRKIVLISLLIFINAFLDACSSLSETCYSLEVSAIKNFTLDTYTALNANDTSAVNDYAILLEAATMSEICLRNHSFGGSLLAEQPIYTLKNEVSNISIKSNADISANYPAGSELKNLFVPLQIQLACIDKAGNDTVCVTDYLSDLGYDSLEETMNRAISQNVLFESERTEDVFALRSNEIISNNKHEFIIQLNYKDGSLVELKTEPIVLN